MHTVPGRPKHAATPREHDMDVALVQGNGLYFCTLNMNGMGYIEQTYTARVRTSVSVECSNRRLLCWHALRGGVSVCQFPHGYIQGQAGQHTGHTWVLGVWFRARCVVQCWLSNVNPVLVFLPMFQEKLELFLVGPTTWRSFKLKWHMLATRFHRILQCIPCVFFSRTMHSNLDEEWRVRLTERYHGGDKWYQSHVLHPVAHWYPLPYLTRHGEGQPFYLCAWLHSHLWCGIFSGCEVCDHLVMDEWIHQVGHSPNDPLDCLSACGLSRHPCGCMVVPVDRKPHRALQLLK